MTLKSIRVTAALRRRFEHVEQAEGVYPIDVAKVALADELIAAVHDQAAARLSRLPSRAGGFVSASIAKRTRRRAS